MKHVIEKITRDNWRPGMPENGWLVRYNIHDTYGWLSCKVCTTEEEALQFAKEL